MLAVSGVIVSVVVLGAASYAWMTMSTSPEMKGIQFLAGSDDATMLSIDGEHFYRTVDISGKFSEDVVLRPVSTIDGLNWFVCDYDKTGNVQQNKFFLLDWHGVHQEGDETSHEYCGCQFYTYTDIWVTTDADEAEIRLSVPHGSTTPEGQAANEELSSGSYVLSYDLVTLEAGGEGELVKKEAVKILSQGPETCARVGMMVFPAVEPDAENNIVLAADASPSEYTDADGRQPEFYIYEPNADVRSELDKHNKDYKADTYVAGLALQSGKDENFYKDGNYIQTYPIALKTSAEIAEEEGSDDEDTVITEPEPVEAGAAVFDPAKLLVQIGTTWNYNAVYGEAASEEGISEGSEDTPKLNLAQEGTKYLDLGKTDLVNKLMLNKYIEKLGSFASVSAIKTNLYNDKNDGAFITGNGDYSSVTIAAEEIASQPIFTLKKGQVRQIRLYFWIEGQDVDCWNDVSGMNFLVRLEFATTLIE